MTPEINEFFKKMATAKGITAILLLFFLSVFIWKNLDFLTEVSFTFKKDQDIEKADENENRGHPDLSFGEIFIPPVSEKLPSILLFEVKNPGSDVTKDVRINLDMGSVKVIDYEVIGPNDKDVQRTKAGLSVLNVDVKQLRPHESLYIYIQSSSPIFKKISLSSSNTSGVEEFRLSDYLEREGGGGSPSFGDFLLFIAGGFILAMSIYFTVVLISKLNAWFKIEW